MMDERSPARKRIRKRLQKSSHASRELLSDPIATPVFRSQAQRPSPLPEVKVVSPQHTTTPRRKTPARNHASRPSSSRRRSSFGLLSTPDPRLSSPNQNSLRTPTPHIASKMTTRTNSQFRIPPTPTPTSAAPYRNFLSPSTASHSPGLLSGQAPLLLFSLHSSSSTSRSRLTASKERNLPGFRSTPAQVQPSRRLSFEGPTSPPLPNPLPSSPPSPLEQSAEVFPEAYSTEDRYPVRIRPNDAINTENICQDSCHKQSDSVRTSNGSHPKEIHITGSKHWDEENMLDHHTPRSAQDKPAVIPTYFISPSDEGSRESTPSREPPCLSRNHRTMTVASLHGDPISTPKATSTLAAVVKESTYLQLNHFRRKRSPMTASGKTTRKKRTHINVDIFQKNSDQRPQNGTRRVVPLRIYSPKDEVESDSDSSSTVPPSPPITSVPMNSGVSDILEEMNEDAEVFCRPVSVSIPAGALRSPSFSEGSNDDR